MKEFFNDIATTVLAFLIALGCSVLVVVAVGLMNGVNPMYMIGLCIFGQ